MPVGRHFHGRMHSAGHRSEYNGYFYCNRNHDNHGDDQPYSYGYGDPYNNGHSNVDDYSNYHCHDLGHDDDNNGSHIDNRHGIVEPSET
jgi:hypothetical protein